MDAQVATARLAMVTIDCADPAAEAEFWSQLLGWKVAHREDAYAMVTGDGPTGPALGFGRVDDYAAPQWPDPKGSQQFHLDLAVDDLDAAEARCRELGATLLDFQPGDGRWRVMRDPAGHPFCLTRADAWA